MTDVRPHVTNVRPDFADVTIVRPHGANRAGHRGCAMFPSSAK
ncbi:MAG TPA: hypothetical protein VFC82_04020 [Actinomycetaceae bacterium]|nr:hypothetical protein [Actinomycetaceae bacterium]